MTPRGGGYNFRPNSCGKQRFTIPESSITLPESAPNFCTSETGSLETAPSSGESAANLTSSIRRQSRSVVSLAGDRGFESVSLQRGVRCEFGLARLGTRPLTDAEYDHERAVASPRRPIYVRERGRTRKGSRCKTSAKPWWFGSRDW